MNLKLKEGMEEGKENHGGLEQPGKVKYVQPFFTIGFIEHAGDSNTAQRCSMTIGSNCTEDGRKEWMIGGMNNPKRNNQ